MLVCLLVKNKVIMANYGNKCNVHHCLKGRELMDEKIIRIKIIIFINETFMQYKNIYLCYVNNKET